jgi:hypothetical protein
MPINPKRRAAFEANRADHLRRIRIPPGSLRNAELHEYVATHVELDGDTFYIALIAEPEGPNQVVGIKINAVAATHLAMAILNEAPALFPGELQLSGDSGASTAKPH